MLSKTPPFVFMQSLDPGVFTSLVTLRVEELYKEPVWLADILSDSACTLTFLTILTRAIRVSMSDISITAITGLTCLKSLYLLDFHMTHSNLKSLYAYISRTTTLTQLKLKEMHCTDHWGPSGYPFPDCDETFELQRLNKLKTLHLFPISCRELHFNPASLEKLKFNPWWEMTASANARFWHDLGGAPFLSSLTLNKISACQEMIQTIPTLTQLQYIRLEGIDMGSFIPRVSPAMTKLESMELRGVKMSSSSWKELFLSVGNLPRTITVKLAYIFMTSEKWKELLLFVGGLQHPATVELFMCRGTSEKEWRNLVGRDKANADIIVDTKLIFRIYL